MRIAKLVVFSFTVLVLSFWFSEFVFYREVMSEEWRCIVEGTNGSMWVRTARKRAEARTFTVPVDAKGRAILSFWVSQAERPEVAEEVTEEAAEV